MKRQRSLSLQDVWAAAAALALSFVGGTQLGRIGSESSAAAHVFAFAALFLLPSGVITAVVCLAKGWRDGLFAGLVCWVGLLIGLSLLAFALWERLPVE